MKKTPTLPSVVGSNKSPFDEIQWPPLVEYQSASHSKATNFREIFFFLLP